MKPSGGGLSRLLRRLWRGSDGPLHRLRSLPVLVLLTAAVGLVTLGSLLFLLLVVSHKQNLFERHYQTLLSINMGVGALLLGIVLWGLWRLVQRLRQGKFGARLMLKLAMTFALVGLLPGGVMYAVSYQFVVRSLDHWFDQEVEGALQAGLNLGAGTLDNLALELVQRAKVATGDWAEQALYGPSLQRLSEQLRADDLQLWSAQGQLQAALGTSRFELAPQGPDDAVLLELGQRGYSTQIEGLDELNEARPSAAAYLHLWARLRPEANPRLNLQGSGQGQMLHVVQRLPAELIHNALQVQTAYREHQERALAREGLRRMYIGTLSLSLILALFAAILLAVLLSNRLMRPLLLLNEGVNKLAAGDLQGQVAVTQQMQLGDELSDLTQSFARMTQDLARAEQQRQASLRQLEGAKSDLQAILDNQSAGVVVLDDEGRILSANASTTRVLRHSLVAHMGRPLGSIAELADFAQQVRERFASLLENPQQNNFWEHSFELQDSGPPPTAHGAQAVEVRVILARGVLLQMPADAGDLINDHWQAPWADESLGLRPGAGRQLLVLDDITAVASGQRSQAWSEMARRLAHEFKNPLTPIQLSAERLEHKLSRKLDTADAQMLSKYVATIVEQVQALSRMLDEFRDFARLPTTQLERMDLHALLRSLEGLYANTPTQVHWQLQADAPQIWGDGQQLRQVVHNLVQNAQDAAVSRYEAELAQDMAEPQAPQVWVRTELSSHAERLRLSVRDNGGGIPEKLLPRIFEPYITSKSKGTGLGLVVVKKIADEHGAPLDVSNLPASEDGPGAGAQISLALRVADGQKELPGL